MFVSGHGVFLTDDHGNDYLDLLSGIGVSALGYGSPGPDQGHRRPGSDASSTPPTYSSTRAPPSSPGASPKLSGMDRVFFCNSGTEAWEAALKIARAHALMLRKQGRHLGTGFLALEHSFHGRTVGSVATTQKLAYREPFAPVMPGVDFVRFNDTADLREKFSNEICAILIEPIQGEGGIHAVSDEFFAEARALCDRTGALLIADEIQCGFGRTGKWFGYQHYGIQPDVTTVAKPLAGGLPIGVMLCTEAVAKAISPGMHGTTFGGNPLACAAAIAVIDTMQQENLLAHVHETGEYFMEHLNLLKDHHPAILEVRGAGLMIGVEIESADLAKAIAAQMLVHRIIINRTSDTVLRFLPPYILEKQHVDQAIAALDSILTSCAAVAPAPILVGEPTHA